MVNLVTRALRIPGRVASTLIDATVTKPATAARNTAIGFDLGREIPVRLIGDLEQRRIIEEAIEVDGGKGSGVQGPTIRLEALEAFRERWRSALETNRAQLGETPEGSELHAELTRLVELCRARLAAANALESTIRTLELFALKDLVGESVVREGTGALTVVSSHLAKSVGALTGAAGRSFAEGVTKAALAQGKVQP